MYDRPSTGNEPVCCHRRIQRRRLELPLQNIFAPVYFIDSEARSLRMSEETTEDGRFINGRDWDEKWR